VEWYEIGAGKEVFTNRTFFNGSLTLDHGRDLIPAFTGRVIPLVISERLKLRLILIFNIQFKEQS